MRIIALIVAVFLIPYASAQSRYLPQPPMDFRGAKPGFGPEQMVWVKPLIRTMGCVFAQNAVRHHLRPAPVGFAPCNNSGEIQVELTENLIDMTVSGTATVGESKRPFSVTLQHYPPSTDEYGFIVTAIKFNERAGP